MNIGFITDSLKFPNLALMKISAYHKSMGDNVDWYNPVFCKEFDKVYYSKIFTFTPTYKYILPDNVELGGTGFDIKKELSDDIDNIFPDYSIYPDCDFALGFITRGCIRKCQWCVVPEKEGNIKPYKRVSDIVRKTTSHLVLLDNNILASDFGLNELIYLSESPFFVDFNQGLDARLVNRDIAKILALIHWRPYIRFSCDTSAVLSKVIEASELLRAFGYKKDIFVYVLGVEPEEILNRINELKKHDLIPFMQPYRDFNNLNKISPIMRQMARWCNKKWLINSCEFENYNDKWRKYPLKETETIENYLGGSI